MALDDVHDILAEVDDDGLFDLLEILEKEQDEGLVELEYEYYFKIKRCWKCKKRKEGL